MWFSEVRLRTAGRACSYASEDQNEVEQELHRSRLYLCSWPDGVSEGRELLLTHYNSPAHYGARTLRSNRRPPTSTSMPKTPWTVTPLSSEPQVALSTCYTAKFYSSTSLTPLCPPAGVTDGQLGCTRPCRLTARKDAEYKTRFAAHTRDSVRYTAANFFRYGSTSGANAGCVRSLAK